MKKYDQASSYACSVNMTNFIFADVLFCFVFWKKIVFFVIIKMLHVIMLLLVSGGGGGEGG